MCEVTKFNFDKLYEDIEEALKKAVFISVDCEFSTLHIKNEYRGSLFDTPSERYQKIRKNLENSIPLQIGLTAFNFDRDDAMYIAQPFKFYVFPAHFGQLDKIFTCQSSGFHFLGEHKFDFNKVIYSGVPYINKSFEEEILNHINNDDFYEYCKYSMESIGQELIKRELTSISKWFYSELDKPNKTIFDINTKNLCIVYLLHKDTRNRFPKQIWTYEENQQFKVKRVSAEEYKQLNDENPLEKQLLTSLLGFTRIYRLLTSLKKPVVGHNFLNDLVLLLNSFETLPSTYNRFKQLVNERFPSVFDTKTISFELLKLLSNEEKWQGNGLKELYEYFKNESGRHLVRGSPRIEIADDFKTYTDDKFHDAGWDAYCTGYCFIRLAHCFAAKKHETHNRRIFMSCEHLKAVECFKNKVNIIRATIPYLNLSGKDRPSQRPPCLIIQSKTQMPVDIFKVTELLREYGSVDIRPHSCKGKRAIAAVANFGSIRRILGHFQNHEDFKIFTYNSMKHSPVIRAALWGGALASGSFLAWFIHSQITKPS